MRAPGEGRESALLKNVKGNLVKGNLRSVKKINLKGKLKDVNNI
jgi:hypothetical protein